MLPEKQLRCGHLSQCDWRRENDEARQACRAFRYVKTDCVKLFVNLSSINLWLTLPALKCPISCAIGAKKDGRRQKFRLKKSVNRDAKLEAG